MHPCGHSSIKFLWSCDTRAQDSFSLFKSTQCFQNMLFYQFMPSSESTLGVQENFHSIHPSEAYTHIFFQNNLVFWMPNLFKEKLEFTSLQKNVGFLVNQIYLFYFIIFIVLLLFFLFWPFFFKSWKIAYDLGTIDTQDYFLLKKAYEWRFTKLTRLHTHTLFLVSDKSRKVSTTENQQTVNRDM